MPLDEQLTSKIIRLSIGAEALSKDIQKIFEQFNVFVLDPNTGIYHMVLAHESYLKKLSAMDAITEISKLSEFKDDVKELKKAKDAEWSNFKIGVLVTMVSAISAIVSGVVVGLLI